VERFTQEMEWLKNETRILSEAELIDILYNNKKVKDVCSMVTFDDGYIDNYELAYPVLKKLDIPATFFIPTKYIEERSLGWWDLTAYIIRNSDLKVATFRGKKYNLFHRENIINSLIALLKETDAVDVENFISELSQSFEVEIPSLQLQGQELMTWAQIIEVSRNGITIGSHTHEHTILSRQSSSEMKKQIRMSKKILERKINKKVESIAYPVGGYSHFNQDAKDISKELGFKLGFSFLTGVNRFPEIDLFDVKRGVMQSYWENLDLAMAFPDRVFLNNCQEQ
jgi:peptidoglycan/xylan/chitin deacetylase (PgdA/CDA1 family)